jgi:3-hydroxybutyryl-CoA dehydratase
MEKPRACKTIEDISVGDRFVRNFMVTDEDLALFARLSSDFNPIHFDEQYAETTIFGQRIAHGMIAVAKFSGIFGMDFPGLGAIWISQSVTFKKPIFIGVSYKAIVELTEKDRRRATFATWVEDDSGSQAIQGSGVVLPISDKAKQRL